MLDVPGATLIEHTQYRALFIGSLPQIRKIPMARCEFVHGHATGGGESQPRPRGPQHKFGVDRRRNRAASDGGGKISLCRAVVFQPVCRGIAGMHAQGMPGGYGGEYLQMSLPRFEIQPRRVADIGPRGKTPPVFQDTVPGNIGEDLPGLITGFLCRPPREGIFRIPIYTA